MKKIVLIFLILLFSFCSKRESQHPRIIVSDVDNVVEVNTKEMLRSQPPFLAMNFVGDTTIINFFYRSKRLMLNGFSDTLKKNSRLKVIIDTSYLFYSKNFVYKNIEISRNIDVKIFEKFKHDELRIPQIADYFKKIDSLKEQYVSSIPVLIYNESNQTKRINKPLDSGFFSMIQEALDVDGKWKPIEFFFENTDCGTGRMDYLLLPKKYMATTILKYYGNFKTKIRIKLRTDDQYYYSNSFTGYINRSQFDQSYVKSFIRNRGQFVESYFNYDLEWALLNHKF